MGDIRSMLNMNGKHRSRADIDRRLYEESLIQSDGNDLDNVKEEDFINEDAQAEYWRALNRLREEGGIIGNLNKSDLLAYSNCFGKYTACVTLMRADDFEYVVQTKTGPRENPIIKTMEEARRGMGESARRLGMTIDGQLKSARVKADQAEEELRRDFGDI